MSQLTFKFHSKQSITASFYVSSNNFSAINNRKLASGMQMLNVFGVSGSGKTHLSKILEKNWKSKIFNVKNVTNDIFKNLLNLFNNYSKI